jgi:hypothetical protein
MRLWSLLIATLAAALLISGPVAAACSTLHRGWAWIIVQDGAEAVEYRAESRSSGWQIQGVTDDFRFCSTCGKVHFSSASDPEMSVLKRLREEVHEPGFHTIDGPHAVELGPLKGEAQRFSLTTSGQTVLDAVVLEAGDGCVTVSLFVDDRGSLDPSPFKSARAITEATAIGRIPRGPASSFDIRCAKSRTMNDFGLFKVWAGVEEIRPWKGSPVPTPSHEEFMRGLQLIP